ncbi:neuronal acetylcholine receptor subunit alpha-9-like [Haliotis cracherodii]|uniref:neuronal acetylcholine receptor subunit alpha-9-like n=1 Tax=Haliotis cracherodii TaxID=6455 RepID=UPI0039EA5984
MAPKMKGKSVFKVNPVHYYIAIGALSTRNFKSLIHGVQPGVLYLSEREVWQCRSSPCPLLHMGIFFVVSLTEVPPDDIVLRTPGCIVFPVAEQKLMHEGFLPSGPLPQAAHKRETVGVFTGMGLVCGATLHHLKQLKEDLFGAYDRHTRPTHDQDEAIHINLTFTLVSIENLDLKSQKIQWHGWLIMKWHDKLLTWNASQYGGLDMILVPQTTIWLPDYTIGNDISATSVLGTSDTLVFIRSSGLVTWEPRLVGETSCKIDIRKYPFDTQTCNFEFLPWMTTSRFLNTTSPLNNIYMSSFKPHGEFTVEGSSVQVNHHKVDFMDDEVVEISFSVVLCRRPTFYWMVMVFPMVTFPLLCPISFLVPVASGEKITLSITVVLSYLVFIGSMNDAMPKLSDTVSLMVMYASIQTMLSILTVVANGIIICIHSLPTTSEHIAPKLVVKTKNTDELEKNPENREDLPNVPIYFDMMKSLTKLNSQEMPLNSGHWVTLARRMDKICFVLFMFFAVVVTVIFGYLFSNDNE